MSQNLIVAAHESTQTITGPASKTNAQRLKGNYPRKIRRAMRMLHEAYCYAEETDRDSWDFAVEIADLKAAGINKTDMRWLLSMGYVESATEVTAAEAVRRQFEQGARNHLNGSICFVSTVKGLEFARDLAGRHAAPSFANRSPLWDADRRELRVLGNVVKRFRLPSNNQERVLLAFQEEGWRTRIDDPLPPKDELDAKQRLHETIKSLNRNQKNRLLRFSGDGTGQGVCWELR